MAKDNGIHLVIDSDDKQDAIDCAVDMDVSLSDFVRIAIRNEVRHRKVERLSVTDRYETRARVDQKLYQPTVDDKARVVAMAVTMYEEMARRGKI